MFPKNQIYAGISLTYTFPGSISTPVVSSAFGTKIGIRSYQCQNSLVENLPQMSPSFYDVFGPKISSRKEFQDVSNVHFLAVLLLSIRAKILKIRLFVDIFGNKPHEGSGILLIRAFGLIDPSSAFSLNQDRHI